MKRCGCRGGLGTRLPAVLLLAAGLITCSACGPKKEAPPEVRAPKAAVKPGIEVLLNSRLDLVKGKKVGLITNPTGLDSRLRSDTS